MAINKVTYGGKTLVDLTTDTVTPDKLASGVTAHDKSGNKITGTMSANFKTYEITLAKTHNWTLLTTLDAEVLEHINDDTITVTLINVSPFEYVWYAGDTYLVGNRTIGYYNGEPQYGYGNRNHSETVYSSQSIRTPANNTSRTVPDIEVVQFLVEDGKYYVRPGDGYIKGGTYRLTFIW